MDLGDDSFIWRHKGPAVAVVVTVAVLLILSIFTGVLEKIGAGTILTLGTILVAMVLVVMAVYVTMELRNISESMNQNSLKLEKIINTLEKSRAGLAQINHSTHLSEAAKAIAFRDANRQALREAVFEKLQNHDFEGALEVIDEIGASGDFGELAHQLRAQCESYRTATDQERITHVIDHIEKLIEDCQWPKASAQVEMLVRSHPNSEKALAMRQKLAEKKQERKRILLAAWDDAIKRQDTDRSIEILRELDAYLSPNEGLALQEAASDVFRTKLHNMGVQFSLAISSRQWDQALNVGQQIVRSFPNSRMSQEIRAKIGVLKHNAEQREVTA